jgi:hypothetical protein
MVPDINEPLSRHTVTVTVGSNGGYRPDPAAFAVAADQAAWSRSASIISAHLADKIISVVTVTAPDRYAAMTVARAVISDALKRQAPSSTQPADDRAAIVRRSAGQRAPEQVAAGVRGPRVSSPLASSAGDVAVTDEKRGARWSLVAMRPGWPTSLE